MSGATLRGDRVTEPPLLHTRRSSGKYPTPGARRPDAARGAGKRRAGAGGACSSSPRWSWRSSRRCSTRTRRRWCSRRACRSACGASSGCGTTTGTGSSTRPSATTTAGRRRRRAARSSRALPAVGVRQAAPPAQAPAKPPPRHAVAAADQARIRPPAAGRGVWKPTGPLVNGEPPVLVTTFRTELAYPRIVAYLGVVRPHADGARLLPRPLRAAERAGARADVGAVRPALAAVRHVQRRLHLHRRPQRLVDRRPRSYEPLKDGLATLIGYRDGRVDDEARGRAGRTPGRASRSRARACR